MPQQADQQHTANATNPFTMRGDAHHTGACAAEGRLTGRHESGGGNSRLNWVVALPRPQTAEEELELVAQFLTGAGRELGGGGAAGLPAVGVAVKRFHIARGC